MEEISNEQLQNILKFYNLIYNSTELTYKYQQLKQQFYSLKYKKQLDVIKWIQTRRGKKYSFNIVGFIHKAGTQKFQNNLHLIQKQDQRDKLVKVNNFSINSLTPITYQDKTFLLKKDIDNKTFLFLERKSGKIYKSNWIVEQCVDKRLIWGTDIASDKHDLKILLIFLLSYRQQNQYPSIIINAGIHGTCPGSIKQKSYYRNGGFYGSNTFEMIFETQGIIKQILQLKQMSHLTNSINKIYLNQNIFPFSQSCHYTNTNNIINLRCYSGFTKISAKILKPLKQLSSNKQNDLQFLSYMYPRTDHFKQSKIILMLAQQNNIIKQFSNKIKCFIRIMTILPQSLIFEGFRQLYKNEKNMLIIVLTNKYKIISAFLPSLKNINQFLNSEEKFNYLCPFIYSISNDDKFELKNSSYQIILNKYQINIGGQCDLRLYPGDKFGNNCQTGINNKFVNSNYDKTEQSYIKLNGNPSSKFQSILYEFWKVQFQ